MTKAIDPEVMPKQSAAVAVRAVGALSVQARVDRVLSLNDQIAGAMRTFAVNVVVCGLELLALKKEVGHGKWLAFFNENLITKGLSDRSANNYMAVAEAFRRKSATRCGFEVKQLSAGTSEISPEQFDAIKAAMEDMTDATTWHQLLLDFGLMRDPKPKGGARPRAERLPTSDELLAQTAHELFVQHINALIALTEKGEHMRLTLKQTTDLIGGLKDVRTKLAEVKR